MITTFFLLFFPKSTVGIEGIVYHFIGTTYEIRLTWKYYVNRRFEYYRNIINSTDAYNIIIYKFFYGYYKKHDTKTITKQDLNLKRV